MGQLHIKGKTRPVQAIQLAAARVVVGGKKGTKHILLYSDSMVTSWSKKRKTKLPWCSRLSMVKHQPLSLNCYQWWVPTDTNITYRLPEDFLNFTTVDALKDKIHHQEEPRWYHNTGCRKGQILHLRLRLKCSDLNNHLVAVNTIDNPSCSCGAAKKTITHFMVYCPHYQEERRELLNLTAALDPSVPTLMYGSNEENEELFLHMQNYLIKTGRFH